MAAAPADPGTAQHGTDPSQVVRCVITRFGLRGRRFLLPTYLDFRRLARKAVREQPPGLLRFAFLVENSTTCYSLSLWSGRPLFSAAVPEHVAAARRVFGRLRLDEERGPELWSTTWRLEATTNNVNWDDLDLTSFIEATALGGAARVA